MHRPNEGGQGYVLGNKQSNDKHSYDIGLVKIYTTEHPFICETAVRTPKGSWLPFRSPSWLQLLIGGFCFIFQ